MEFPLFVKDIQHKNPYDFTKEHRHDYYEVFFFVEGGGTQLIDFINYPVLPNSCYIVFPQQVHLLRRAPEASGYLVQFPAELVPSNNINTRLNQISFSLNAAVIFENDPESLKKLLPCLAMLKEETERKQGLSKEIAINILQALLLKLIEFGSSDDKSAGSEIQELLLNFHKLLEEQYQKNHSVSNYAAQLNITEKKLSAITKKSLGLTPLQVIHNRVLLEAKRKLLFEDLPHKELAYQLGFDSPASFSLFVKNKTGLNPSQLHSKLVNFHM